MKRVHRKRKKTNFSNNIFQCRNIQNKNHNSTFCFAFFNISSHFYNTIVIRIKTYKHQNKKIQFFQVQTKDPEVIFEQKQNKVNFPLIQSILPSPPTPSPSFFHFDMFSSCCCLCLCIFTCLLYEPLQGI